MIEVINEVLTLVPYQIGLKVESARFISRKYNHVFNREMELKKLHQERSYCKGPTIWLQYNKKKIQFSPSDKFAKWKIFKKWMPYWIWNSGCKGRVKIYRVPGPGPLTGGRRLFFEKNRGTQTFFRKKLGGGDFFPKKLRWAKTFFR